MGHRITTGTRSRRAVTRGAPLAPYTFAPYRAREVAPQKAPPPRQDARSHRPGVMASISLRAWTRSEARRLGDSANLHTRLMGRRMTTGSLGRRAVARGPPLAPLYLRPLPCPLGRAAERAAAAVASALFSPGATGGMGFRAWMISTVDAIRASLNGHTELASLETTTGPVSRRAVTRGAAFWPPSTLSPHLLPARSRRRGRSLGGLLALVFMREGRDDARLVALNGPLWSHRIGRSRRRRAKGILGRRAELRGVARRCGQRAAALGAAGLPSEGPGRGLRWALKRTFEAPRRRLRGAGQADLSRPHRPGAGPGLDGFLSDQGRSTWMLTWPICGPTHCRDPRIVPPETT